MALEFPDIESAVWIFVLLKVSVRKGSSNQDCSLPLGEVLQLSPDLFFVFLMFSLQFGGFSEKPVDFIKLC